MKYFLVAGEASGDLHASNLMKSLMLKDPEADFSFFGGDLMLDAGGTLIRHYRDMAFMRIIPVLLHLKTIMCNMRICREAIRNYHPDVVILVDYPGFNLKIAKFVKTKLKIPIFYYISPKIWAWKKYRIKSFRMYVDRMFCILPFEVDFYKSLNYPVDYVGNSSVDSVADFLSANESDTNDFRKIKGLSEKPILAILAGSRKAEIRQNLPTLLEVAIRFSDFQPVIAGAPGLKNDDYRQALNTHPDIPIFFSQTYAILSVASYALVTSGTATLETALFRVPQVVCYYVAGGKFVNFAFRRFFHISYISLVNLIAGNDVVQELFGGNFSFQNIHAALSRIIHDDNYRTRMLEGYDRVIEAVGKPGASERTAKLIVHSLKKY